MTHAKIRYTTQIDQPLFNLYDMPQDYTCAKSSEREDCFTVEVADSYIQYNLYVMPQALNIPTSYDELIAA